MTQGGGGRRRSKSQGDEDAEIYAEEIVFGTFKIAGGTVTAIDPATNQIKINDLQTKKPLTIVLKPESVLRRFPAGGMFGGNPPEFKEGDRAWAGAAVAEIPDLSVDPGSREPLAPQVLQQLLVLAFAPPHDRGKHLEPGPLGKLHHLVDDLLRGLAPDRPPAVVAMGAADPGEQHP